MSAPMDHCVVMVKDDRTREYGPEEIEFDGFGDDLTSVVLCGRRYEAADIELRKAAEHEAAELPEGFMVVMKSAAGDEIRVDLDVTFIEILRKD